MRNLEISIEWNGNRIPTGRIVGSSPEDAVFSYLPEYLDRKEARPVSIHLPLQKEAFSPKDTRCFFEGLLPEGFTRKSVAGWMHVDEGDYLSILSGLGRECLGALQVREEGMSLPGSSYEKLQENRLLALAQEGAAASSELMIRTHLSLTGASGKAGLYFEEETGTWYLPKGDAPSTHILKQSHVRLLDIVANEQLCMLTAGKLGIETPESFVVKPADGSREDVLFAVRRFDRIFGSENRYLDGKKVPYRLHQEDFAQALGIPASGKYETEKRGYLGKMFSLLRYWSSEPMADQLRLWDILCFDYLAGNTDNHLKNLSLLYGKDLSVIWLAPVYDLVSTTVYEGASRNMSCFIGDTSLLDEITEDSFAQAAAEAGMNSRMCLKRLSRLTEGFEEALGQSAREMEEAGITYAPAIGEQILKSGGIARFR